MAQRRMFSQKIIDTDNFLDMPVSARELYFEFGMRADDDGFVSNPKKIMKMIGAGDDDIKVLISKSFIIPFHSGVCVISDWKIHNYIQNDRYQETQFKAEKSTLSEDANGKYLPAGTEPKCIQAVSTSDTQVRLGKVRLGKDRIIKNKDSRSENESFDLFWSAYPKKVGKKKAESCWAKIRPDTNLLANILNSLDRQKKSPQWTKDGGQFIPHAATWLNQERWNDEVDVKVGSGEKYKGI
jgi:hypothetical protein